MIQSCRECGKTLTADAYRSKRYVKTRIALCTDCEFESDRVARKPELRPGAIELRIVSNVPNRAEVFGESVRVARVLRDLTQEDLAAELGWSQAKLSRIEKGRRDVRLSEANDLARALGCSVEALLSPTRRVEVLA